MVKKRIALFLPSLRGGGAERMLLNLAIGFANRGYAVDLVLVRAEGAYMEKVPGSIRIVDLKASRVLLSLPALIRYLVSEKPDSFLSAMDHANLIAILARSIAKVPLRLVVSIRNTLSVSISHSELWRNKLIPFLAKGMYRKADAVVAVSKGVADDFAAYTGFQRNLINVVYNPVITPELKSQMLEKIDHPWFDSKEIPVILGAGRLTKAKDFKTLIKAFAKVHKQRRCRLMILGEGGERPELEGLIKQLNLEDYAKLPGFVENPFAYMSQSALFVLSSAWEGLPGVLIQALACGLPVVSTDCPSGPEEILQEGKFGRLVPVGDVDALAEAIALTLDSPRESLALQRRAQCFDVDRICDEYLNILGLNESCAD